MAFDIDKALFGKWSSDKVQIGRLIRGCTRVENLEGRVSQIFPKIVGGVQGFWNKISTLCFLLHFY